MSPSADGRPSPGSAAQARARRVEVLRGQITRLRQFLQVTAGRDRAETRRRLDALAAALRAEDSEIAAEAVTGFLGSRVDGSTGLGFQVGPQGKLVEAPSLRVALLDWLGRINPAAGARYAEEVFRDKTSPEEWALALRNVGRVSEAPADRAALLPVVEEMLSYGPWLQSPSDGFLQAVDAAVYSRDSRAVPLLARLAADPGSNPLRHAGQLALDKLALEAPAQVLTALQDDPTLLSDQGGVRANLFARADLEDPAQRASLEAYLTRPELTDAELAAFVDAFPNADSVLSRNLLSQDVPVRSLGEVARRHRSALVAVQRWVDDPRFARLQPSLPELRGQLQELVASAAKGGY